MVHALEIVHRLLKPEGRLIDIHPSGIPPVMEAVRGNQRFLLGYLQETDDFIEYRQASAALEQAVRRGLFAVERQDTFTFIIHADSAPELYDYLVETWADAVPPTEILTRASELATAGETLRVEMSEGVAITRLKPNG